MNLFIKNLHDLRETAVEALKTGDKGTVLTVVDILAGLNIHLRVHEENASMGLKNAIVAKDEKELFERALSFIVGDGLEGEYPEEKEQFREYLCGEGETFETFDDGDDEEDGDSGAICEETETKCSNCRRGCRYRVMGE